MKYFFRLLKNLDKSILILVSVLAVISLVMISSTAYSDGFVINRDIIIQALAYLLGFIAVVILIFIDYKSYLHFEKIIYGVSIAFLLTVYIPFIGKEHVRRALVDTDTACNNHSAFGICKNNICHTYGHLFFKAQS